MPAVSGRLVPPSASASSQPTEPAVLSDSPVGLPEGVPVLVFSLCILRSHRTGRGSELSRITEPFAFTGRAFRRRREEEGHRGEVELWCR